ncbi:MAG: ABC transporter permease [Pirellulales bacterium]
MTWIALKMLTGNRGKYLGIILGIAFATLLIAQQASIFCGLMLQTSGQIRDIQGADIWVMDPNVQFSDDVKPLSDSDLYRVRGVEGVAWAVPLYKGLTRSRLDDGNFQQTILLGLDDATLVGGPPEMVLGNIFDLRRPDAVIMDLEGYKLLWPHEAPRVGKRFEMNDKEAEIVGICKASRTFQTFPVVYTRYSQALQFVPPERKVLSFVLADVLPGQNVDEICRRIQKQTGMRAMTGQQFEWVTMKYFMEKTGIPFNFGITVALGFIVGTAIAAQTFYLFTIENIKQYGALKAMGAGNFALLSMIMLQALLVSFIGFGLGIGAATWFGKIATAPGSRLAFYMPAEVFVGVALAVAAISILSSLLSMQKVMVVEPAVVFQG